jgi:hypothetical protein
LASLKVEPYTVLPNIIGETSLPVHGAVEGKYSTQGTKVTLLVQGCGKRGFSLLVVGRGVILQTPALAAHVAKAPEKFARFIFGTEP